MNPIRELDKLLQESGVRIKFGLREQGHIPKVQRMLSEGCSWEDIGVAIGWCPKAAKDWYYRFERLDKPPSQEE